MLYRTIVLILIEQRPDWHQDPGGRGKLLEAVERLAGELRSSHQSWTERLARPGSSPSRTTAGEALEPALRDLTASWLTVSRDLTLPS